MSSEPTYCETLTVESENGLHLVPCSQIARVAGEFSGTVTLRNGEKVADAKTILEIVSLGGTQGTHIEVEAVGDGCEGVVAAIRQLFETGFPTE
ncbi:MAG: HPr family phosphocarrier protein [Planctomycetaceae bacterium]